jgi:Domain of unknown function (DUF4129)
MRHSSFFIIYSSFKSTDRLKICPTLFVYLGKRVVWQVFNLSKLFFTFDFNLQRLRLFYLTLTPFAYLLFCTTDAISAQLDNYAERIGQAESIVDILTEGEPSSSEILNGLTKIKHLLPAAEEIEFRGMSVQVDNSWLHEAVDNVIKHINDDTDNRWSMLIDIYFRLSFLKDRLDKSELLGGQTQDHKALLEQILARPEYRKEKVKESTVNKWLKSLWARVDKFLSDLELQRQNVPTGSVMVPGFRILLLLFLLAALVFGVIHLMKRLRTQSRPEDENEDRQVLGEEIKANLTPAEIFARATELARQGDYRSAIRRAYIALLLELEIRGKLRLHQSMTNRDYLEAISREPTIFPAFSSMTWTFEKVWYGQVAASGEHFEDFVNRYQETIAKS